MQSMFYVDNTLGGCKKILSEKESVQLVKHVRFQLRRLCLFIFLFCMSLTSSFQAPKHCQQLRQRLSAHPARWLMSNTNNFDFLVSMKTVLPEEITSSDSISSLSDLYNGVDASLLPNTAISALDGGDNLGALLWAFVLYNGIFTSQDRPAEWVLRPLARTLNCTQEQWYKDFEAGYQYVCPAPIAFLRFGLFALLGFTTSALVTSSFGGDAFWGWSVGTCLALPSAFLLASRNKKKSRAEGDLESEIDLEFEAFRQKRVSIVPIPPEKQGKWDNSGVVAGSPSQPRTVEELARLPSVAEMRLLTAFRRSCTRFRDEEAVPDKVLTKRIRRILGQKPYEGRYYGISLSTPESESRRALAASLAKAEKLKQEFELQLEEERRKEKEREREREKQTVGVPKEAAMEDEESKKLAAAGSASSDDMSDFVRR